MKEIKNHYDVAVIGGGFYGCSIALFLKKIFKNVVIIEKEADLLLKASYNNQARIHNGYHYPRSIITALRSHENYSKFISEFKPAVVSKHTMLYAIARNNSKITSAQFVTFCKQIGSPINPAPLEMKRFFDQRLIEDVFLVEENVFNVVKLRNILKEQLTKNNISLLYNTEVLHVNKIDDKLRLKLKNGTEIISKRVINCTYANINTILKNSSLPPLPLKHELTEMPLVKLPPELTNMGITILDGPFFSFMPFPAKGLHTIHHVRYTPHATRSNNEETESLSYQKSINNSRFIYMLKDAKRYIPIIDKLDYKESLYEIKTVLEQTEFTDARPILFRKDYGIKNFYIVLGGKIDNIYDVIDELKKSF